MLIFRTRKLNIGKVFIFISSVSILLTDCEGTQPRGICKALNCDLGDVVEFEKEMKNR